MVLLKCQKQKLLKFLLYCVIPLHPCAPISTHPQSLQEIPDPQRQRQQSRATGCVLQGSPHHFSIAEVQAHCMNTGFVEVPEIQISLLVLGREYLRQISSS